LFGIRHDHGEGALLQDAEKGKIARRIAFLVLAKALETGEELSPMTLSCENNLAI
jgi:hypothetical protein